MQGSAQNDHNTVYLQFNKPNLTITIWSAIEHMHVLSFFVTLWLMLSYLPLPEPPDLFFFVSLWLTLSPGCLSSLYLLDSGWHLISCLGLSILLHPVLFYLSIYVVQEHRWTVTMNMDELSPRVLNGMTSTLHECLGFKKKLCIQCEHAR